MPDAAIDEKFYDPDDAEAALRERLEEIRRGGVGIAGVAAATPWIGGRSMGHIDALDREAVGGAGQPPIGARGFAPQNSCVPSIPMMCTETMLTTIDLAVAVPTPTGPPLAVNP